MPRKSARGRKHPHKGSHAPRRKHHLSPAGRAARVGKKHPHKGSHGRRQFKGRHFKGRRFLGRKTKGRKPRPIPKRHISSAADARRFGKKHPHAGHGKGHPKVRVVKQRAPRKTTARRPVPHVSRHTGHRIQRHGHYRFMSRFHHSRHHRLRSQFIRRRHAFRNRFTRHRRR